MWSDKKPIYEFTIWCYGEAIGKKVFRSYDEAREWVCKNWYNFESAFTCKYKGKKLTFLQVYNYFNISGYNYFKYSNTKSKYKIYGTAQ